MELILEFATHFFNVSNDGRNCSLRDYITPARVRLYYFLMQVRMRHLKMGDQIKPF